jgi:hypothetical protein
MPRHNACAFPAPFDLASGSVRVMRRADAPAKVFTLRELPSGTTPAWAGGVVTAPNPEDAHGTCRAPSCQRWTMDQSEQ